MFAKLCALIEVILWPASRLLIRKKHRKTWTKIPHRLKLLTAKIICKNIRTTKTKCPSGRRKNLLYSDQQMKIQFQYTLEMFLIFANNSKQKQQFFYQVVYEWSLIIFPSFSFFPRYSLPVRTTYSTERFVPIKIKSLNQ